MIVSRLPERIYTTRASAFTIVESLISVVVVGGLVVAALNTVGASATSRKSSGDRAMARLLAQDLMAEIVTKPYEDPDGSPIFGPEVGEGTTTRAAFDDVDDYHGWSSSPKYRDGTVWPDRASWKRVVTVEYVDASDLSVVLASDSGVKRITIRVEHESKALVIMTTARTISADSAADDLLP